MDLYVSNNFGLAQKQYNFTHNDLHCENIMYAKTDSEFIYYEFERKMFKIPTGKILKIIGLEPFINMIIRYISVTILMGWRC